MPPVLLTAPLVPSGEIVPPLIPEVNVVPLTVGRADRLDLRPRRLSACRAASRHRRRWSLPVGETLTVVGSTSVTEEPTTMLALNGGFNLVVFLPFLLWLEGGASDLFSSFAAAAGQLQLLGGDAVAEAEAGDRGADQLRDLDRFTADFGAQRFRRRADREAPQGDRFLAPLDLQATAVGDRPGAGR